MPLLQNEEVETLRARVRELESLLGQRCDGIDCDRGEECVELQKQLNELRRVAERVREACAERGYQWSSGNPAVRERSAR